MQPKKRNHSKPKPRLHPRNKHRSRYDLQALIGTCFELKQFVNKNKYGDWTINFFEPKAVKMLNKALLLHYYDLEYWDIPPRYLCPPIPGRADYIHNAADLLAKYFYDSPEGKIPKGSKIKVLDIGVGANCVYPIIGNKEYGWSFIGSEIDHTAVESAQKIVDNNPVLKDKVEIRLQPDLKNIFKGIINKDERIDLAICNPPFHASAAEARAGSERKLRNLRQGKTKKTTLNFGGQSNELWYEGGEVRFAENMVYQSRHFAESCFWFSTLISKQDSLDYVYHALEEVGAVEVKTIPMGQGNKFSRLVAWTFLEEAKRREWVKERWN